MIPELWDFFTTISNKQARENGYLYHSIALAHRARRCHRHWLGHLQACHERLSNVLPTYQEGSRVAVLGSGIMLETPLEILTQRFEHIDLVDVVHTKDVRDLVAKYGLQHNLSHRFKFVELDLNESELRGEYDYVISANLLSQLSYVLAKNKRKLGASESEISEMTTALQGRHLKQIKSVSDKFLLYSDFELRIRNLFGEVIETSPTVDQNLNLKWENQWTWNLAPAPEFSKEHSVELLVGMTLKI